MIKALVIKELREVYWIAAVALVVYLVTVSGLIGVQPVAHFLTVGKPRRRSPATPLPSCSA